VSNRDTELNEALSKKTSKSTRIEDRGFKAPNARAWGPVLLWMGLIFFLSSRSSLPAIPGLDELTWSDKIKHFLFYAVLGGLIWRAIAPNRPKWWRIGLSIAISAFYGLSDELHQLYVPGRSCDMCDLAADTLGAAAGAFILTYWIGGDGLGRRKGTRKKLRGKG